MDSLKQKNNLMSYTKDELADELLRMYQKEDDLLSLVSLQELVLTEQKNKIVEELSSSTLSAIRKLMSDAQFRPPVTSNANTIKEFGDYLRAKLGKHRKKTKKRK
ncbi:hypothetical protein CGI18_07135 [Vibrio parahaemolyticus]|uniref:hypothetical protein n=1 Tax=Vibrio parahaemolyticus TaxID=670 RepID=UPI00111D8B37|nr:hypothetical protein [Vibrio parahaemolyticus]TOK48258.1 hypothetical protein CGI18_07135 [Vibrio parahaemolyticus]